MTNTSLPLDDEVKKKIASIRTNYTRERGKVKSKSGDGAEDVYVPKWVHFKRFSFLDDFITAKQSISNLQKVKIMFHFIIIQCTTVIFHYAIIINM